MTAPLRLNARLDATLSDRLARAKKRSGKTVTQLVHEALEAYCEKSEREASSAYQTLEELGLIGCADGPSDLSANYKAMLGESLEEKHSQKRRSARK